LENVPHVSVSLLPADPEIKGKSLIANVIDPEISSFERWFSAKAGGPLTSLERELLRAYLYRKLRGDSDE